MDAYCQTADHRSRNSDTGDTGARQGDGDRSATRSPAVSPDHASWTTEFRITGSRDAMVPTMDTYRQTADRCRSVAAVADPEARQGDPDRSAALSTETPAMRQALFAIARLLGRHAALEHARSGTPPTTPSNPGEHR
jgi:hypothetical protein